ncbi:MULTISPECIES: universal stress protein [unclassified Streptomyces]|uniref:universal stress protein n=1 Tax=unclassified Streptomyces TaxID=2593676 RepID=UPI0036EB5B9E
MSRNVTVGFDGSPESRAAAEWAAREAHLRGLPLRVVHAWEPVPEPMAQAPLLGAETQQHWSERIPREAVEEIALRHPEVEVDRAQLSGRPADVLVDAAKEADLLVLGSRGMSGIGGFLVGSVGLAVVAHTETPVVLVRAGQPAADEREPESAGIPAAAASYAPVVLGLDPAAPDDSVIEFAFEAAVRRSAALRVVHGWNLPPYYAYSPPAGLELHDEIARAQSAALAEALRPWRQKYPDVQVTEVCRSGNAARCLVDAAGGASLVVVGRKIRRNPFGAHIGPVAHAVLHHAATPVAVVAHN